MIAVTNVRQEVIETIIDAMRAAEDQGGDAMAAAEAAFPGTPGVVLWEAWAELEDRRTEAWWEQVERTIDGEIVKAALLAQGRRT